MKNKLEYLKKLNRENLARAGFGVIALGASAASFAELPAPATAAITSISGSVTEMETAVWPVIGAVVLAMIIIKLFKRFTGKI
jgi:hypothetical protein